jgi:hypothetical protein
MVLCVVSMTFLGTNIAAPLDVVHPVCSTRNLDLWPSFLYSYPLPVGHVPQK